MKTISIIDSHTGGEPTRLVIDGGPDLCLGPLSERVARLRAAHEAAAAAVESSDFSARSSNFLNISAVLVSSVLKSLRIVLICDARPGLPFGFH